MVRLRVTPTDLKAGGTRFFNVHGFTFDPTSRVMVLSLHNAKMDVHLGGGWEIEATSTIIGQAHTGPEAESILSGSSLVTLVN